jgi:hypothetical protein
VFLSSLFYAMTHWSVDIYHKDSAPSRRGFLSRSPNVDAALFAQHEYRFINLSKTGLSGAGMFSLRNNNSAAHGFQAIGTIFAGYCILMFTLLEMAVAVRSGGMHATFAKGGAQRLSIATL